MSRVSPNTMQVDIAILGGGLAGLSLAVRLQALCQEARFAHLKSALVEPRGAYQHDRHWGFWDVQAHPFTSIIKHRWPKTRIVGDDRDTSASKPPFNGTLQALGSETSSAVEEPAYCAIASGDFYAHCLQVMARTTHITRVHATATQLAALEAGASVSLDNGTTLHATLVLDSRLPAKSAPASSHALEQRFVGYAIDTASPVFDANVATLLDFQMARAQTSSQTGVHFSYVLPFSARQALVYDTWFVAPDAPPIAHRTHMEQYVRTHLTAQFTVTGEEPGVIPMDANLGQARSAFPHTIAFGTAGGAVRPATGYAFLQVQTQADAISQAIATHGVAGACAAIQGRAPSYATPTLWMDRVMLGALKRHPETAAPWFTQLFERTPRDRLVRFLTHGGAWADKLAVMRALPAMPLLRAAWRDQFPAAHAAYTPKVC
jgi:lycopene beta-cyclase